VFYAKNTTEDQTVNKASNN